MLNSIKQLPDESFEMFIRRLHKQLIDKINSEGKLKINRKFLYNYNKLFESVHFCLIFGIKLVAWNEDGHQTSKQ